MSKFKCLRSGNHYFKNNICKNLAISSRQQCFNDMGSVMVRLVIKMHVLWLKCWSILHADSAIQHDAINRVYELGGYKFNNEILIADVKSGEIVPISQLCIWKKNGTWSRQWHVFLIVADASDCELRFPATRRGGTGTLPRRHRHGHRQNRLQLVAWGNHAQQQNTKRSISCDLRVQLQWITNGRGLAVWETLGQGRREERSSSSRLDRFQDRGVQLKETEPTDEMSI